ncbi:hypothetical protein UFOVP713_30 [uncultured Caudovirales phage]|uniref:Uncharacterized protein n=1 Tax=uncultured Caudovirales phage TaxID=2100421 RepID=A0A6J5NGH5_9CAUD|nr:hypothetical protein UFOVP713_30 [uncultured Caudovirales phage]
MADGLIAAAIGGFGKALSSIGEMEAKKQNEAKLRRELMDMESEERLRLDEIMFERKMKRLPQEATATAEANVTAEAAGYAAAEKLNLPTIRAKTEVGKKTAQYAAEDEAGLTTIEAKRDAEKLKAGITAKSEAGLPEAQGAYAAREKIEARLAELNLSALKNLSALEAKAKYDALIADIDAAEKSNIDVREARRKANAILADINAKKEAGVPKAEADAAADKRVQEIKSLEEKGVYKVEAQGAANKRLEEIRAVTEKGLIQEEAALLARQELAKVQAMTAQGVPEAKAKLLAAEWKAGKTQRDEAAAEQTQQKINSEIETARKLAGDKNFLKDVAKIDIAKGAGERYNALYRENLRDSSEKKERSRNTIEMERQIKETNNEIGRIIGIGDPKKIPDELSFLESQASKGDAKAIDKLKKVKPLLDELTNLSRDLRSYKRGGTNTSAGEATYKKGEERTLSDGPNKGKTVVWDGTKWNLK